MGDGMRQNAAGMTQRWTHLVWVFVAALVLGTLNVVAPVDPHQDANAGNNGSCEVDGGSAHNGLKVYPSHGSVFYIDTGQGQEINAAYVGYRVENTTGSTMENLWAQIDTFTGGVVSLSNPLDRNYRVGDVASGATGASFFLLQANQPTTTDQTHDITIYDADPDAGGSSLYSCTFTFVEVMETIKAAANKVTEVATTSVEELGGYVQVTVTGQTGVIGSGASSPDGEVLWFSPAARSSWPSSALVLESTSIQTSTNKNLNKNLQTHSNTLIFRSPTSTLAGSSNKYYYEAVYVFRIKGPVSGTAQVIPIAQISSGTRIKHTDISGITSDADSSFTVETPVNVDVGKAVSSTASDSDSADGRYEFDYTLTFTNTSSNQISLDQVVDDFDSGLEFFQAVDAEFNSNPVPSAPVVNSDGNLVFQGPFDIPGNSSRTLTYTMEETSVCSGQATYSNFAWAMVGNQVVTAVEGVTLTTASTCGDPASSTTTSQAIDPVAVTQAASSVSATAATINASVNPKGLARTVSFEWGTDSTLSTKNTVTLTDSSSDSTFQDVSSNLSSLNPGTAYYFRIKIGDVYGEIMSFTTAQAAADPETTTQATSAIDSSAGTATLNGSFDANLVSGGATPSFEWALADSSGGTNTCSSPGTLSSAVVQEDTDDDGTLDANILLTGGFPANLSLDISSLTTNKYYCARSVVTWNSGANSTTGNFVVFQVASNATISYDANSNTSGSAPTTANPAIGSSYTVASNSGTLTRTGWSFAGWNTASDGSGTTYAAGSGSFLVSGSQTLYAKWTATVSYDANGGTGAPTDLTAYTASDSVTVKSDTGMARTNFVFSGWNTSSNGSGTPYADGASLSIPSSGDLTLYAQWDAVFTVTFDANAPGGAGLDSGSVPSALQVNDGSSGTVPGNTGSMTVANFSFLGWDTDPNATSATFAPNDSITPSASDTLYAVWVGNYAVTFSGNSNTGGTPPSALSTSPGGAITVPTNSGVLVRTNFVFGGWNTASDGSGDSYQSGASFTPSSSTTLHARWLTARTISYDGNGSTSGSAPTDAMAGESATYTVASNSGNLARTGFRFAGWQTTPTGGSQYVAGSGSFTVSGSVTLYARWSTNNSGGSGNGGGSSDNRRSNRVASPETPLVPPTVATRAPLVATPPTVPSDLPRTQEEDALGPGAAGPNPTAPPSDRRGEQPPGLQRLLANGAATVDLGRGVESTERAEGEPSTASGELQQNGSRTPTQIRGERLQGFQPGASTRIEIVGARSGARFVVSDTVAIDNLTLVNAINQSIASQRADFFGIEQVQPVTEPLPSEPWEDDQRAEADFLFEAAGLDAPANLGDFDTASFSNWVFVQSRAATYLPGSTVYLAVTSDPVVIGQAVVDANGEATLTGTFPAEILGAGEHRVRLVGTRALDGVLVDDEGSIQVTNTLMEEIQRFDLGTQSTIAISGANPTGELHTAVRIIPLVPQAPWWTLSVVGGVFTLFLILWWRGLINTLGRRIATSSVLVVAGLPAVILGWISTVTAVVWWGLGLTFLSMVAAAIVMGLRREPSRRAGFEAQ
jgi:uncharacterized repeat protein (TIGR02543 family)